MDRIVPRQNRSDSQEEHKPGRKFGGFFKVMVFSYETSFWPRPRASGLSEMDGFLYLRNIAGAMLSALASVLSLIFGTLVHD